MKFRNAISADVFNIIQLYHQARIGAKDDPLFLDYRLLIKSIESNYTHWIITELRGTVIAAIAVDIDFSQGVSKIAKLLIDPMLPGSGAILRESIKYLLYYMQHSVMGIDLIYTTTLSISLEHQNITLDEGFRILGVFPNLMGLDSTKMNGLSAYFFNDTLGKKRSKGFSIHPDIAPFFEISKKECHLPALQTAKDLGSEMLLFQEILNQKELPILELIHAKSFVRYRFKKLKEHRSQLENFYPFYAPNCMITDPAQEVEIFIRLNESMGFAAIIGEHLNISVNPIILYKKVQEIIRTYNISYIEIINDASDTFGIDAILKAEFTPCAYFPAFKRQGASRRDYVIFGKSFEHHCRPSSTLNEIYQNFYREYFKIEGKNYFPHH